MHRPLLGLALAAIVFQAPAIAQVRIEALGTLPAASITVGSAISGDGSIVGGFAAGVGAVRWSKSTGWQPLTALSAGQSSYAAGVNDDGSIVAGAITSGSSSRGFRWSSVTGVIDIGSMTVDDLSGDGTTVVGSSSGGTRAFRWNATGPQDLGINGQAYGVSGDGSIVVGVAVSGGSTYQAFRWTSETGTQLLSSASISVANAISRDGSTIVGYEGSNQRIAGRWTAESGWQSLGVASGFGSSVAESVSGNGAVVIGHGESAIGQRACLWTASTGMVDLQTYLNSIGVDMSGWTYLDAAIDISADGRFILGSGSFNGEYQSFVAVIPGPGGFTLFMLSLCHRKRRAI